MPDQEAVKTACCDGKDECLNEIKGNFPPLPVLKKTVPLLKESLSKLSYQDAEKNIKDTALLNCWCSVIWMFVILILFAIMGAIAAGIQGFCSVVISNLLSLWFLHCCIKLNDECCWKVVTVWFGIGFVLGVVNIIQWLGLISADITYLIIIVCQVPPVICAFLFFRYSCMMCMSWPGSSTTTSGSV